jgi:hypothetical protein
LPIEGRVDSMRLSSSGDSPTINRATAIRASLAVCVATTIPWLRETKLADAASLPELVRRDRIQEAIVRALLAFDDPAFPRITPRALSRRIDAIFGLRNDPNFSASLILFDRLPAFVRPPAAVRLAERALGAGDEQFAQGLSSDTAAFDRWYREDASSFASLPLQRAREYARLWLMSDLGVRRRFFGSLKVLVMTAAYSLDAVWNAIRYEGPFKDRRR